MTCCQQALHKGFSGYIIGLQQEELFDICFLWLAFFGSKQCPSSQKKRATVHPGGYTSHLSWLPDALHFNDTVQTLPAFCFTTIHLFAGLALSLSPFRERQCSKYMHLSFFLFLSIDQVATLLWRAGGLILQWHALEASIYHLVPFTNDGLLIKSQFLPCSVINTTEATTWQFIPVWSSVLTFPFHA